MQTENRSLKDELSEDERQLLKEALTLLREKRGKAWNVACDDAQREGRREPGLGKFDIPAIKRLAKRFGIQSTHRMEEDTLAARRKV